MLTISQQVFDEGVTTKSRVADERFEIVLV